MSCNCNSWLRVWVMELGPLWLQTPRTTYKNETLKFRFFQWISPKKLPPFDFYILASTILLRTMPRKWSEPRCIISQGGLTLGVGLGPQSTQKKHRKRISEKHQTQRGDLHRTFQRVGLSLPIPIRKLVHTLPDGQMVSIEYVQPSDWLSYLTKKNTGVTSRWPLQSGRSASRVLGALSVWAWDPCSFWTTCQWFTPYLSLTILGGRGSWSQTCWLHGWNNRKLFGSWWARAERVEQVWLWQQVENVS